MFTRPADRPELTGKSRRVDRMTSTEDVFGTPTSGGAYPKMDDLEGKLLLCRPSKIETVPGYQGKGTTERVTADVTVFDTDGSAETFDDMYLSQAGIVPSMRKALKPGNPPFVLGVVRKFPSKTAKKDGIDTTEKLEAALTEWLKKGGKGEKPQFAWGLDQPDDEQKNTARQYLAAHDPFAS